jgi:hypothetical protein
VISDETALASEYASQLRGLFAAAPGPAPAVDDVAARAERLAAVSRQVSERTVPSLDAGDPAAQTAAEMRLLAHATAGLEAARGLFAVAYAATSPIDAAGLDAGGWSSTSAAQASLNEIADLFESPPRDTTTGTLDAAAGPEPASAPPVASATPPSAGTGVVAPSAASVSPETGAPAPQGAAMAPPAMAARVTQAKQQLIQQAGQAVDAITNRACVTIEKTVVDLLAMDASVLYEGVRLVSKDAAEGLSQAAAALGAAAVRLTKSAIELVLQALDSILALLGGAAQARAQVATWVKQLKMASGPTSGPVAQLVRQLFAPDAVKNDVTTWSNATAAPPEKIGQTASTVQALVPHYDTSAQWVERLVALVSFVRAIPVFKTPMGAVVVAAVLTGLMGYSIYNGYCHVDTGRITFNQRFGFEIPQRTQGIRATVMKTLAGTPA